MEEFGPKVQISGSDGSFLCKDGFTANEAKQTVVPKMAQKEKRSR